MLRRIVIIAAIIVIPVGVWIAGEYGRMQEVTFAQAMAIASASSEGEQAPKVMVTAVIERLGDAQADGHMEARDREGRRFLIDYTGQTPDRPMSVGGTFSFVGHVHGGTPPTFHATQVYE
jgi:hypothetical protein